MSYVMLYFVMLYAMLCYTYVMLCYVIYYAHMHSPLYVMSYACDKQYFIGMQKLFVIMKLGIKPFETNWVAHVIIMEIDGCMLKRIKNSCGTALTISTNNPGHDYRPEPIMAT